MKIITTSIVDQARQERIHDVINELQSPVLELNATMQPTYGQSMKIGRARKHLLAAIAAKDRAERLEAVSALRWRAAARRRLRTPLQPPRWRNMPWSAPGWPSRT